MDYPGQGCHAIPECGYRIEGNHFLRPQRRVRRRTLPAVTSHCIGASWNATFQRPASQGQWQGQTQLALPALHPKCPGVPDPPRTNFVKWVIYATIAALISVMLFKCAVEHFLR